MSFILDYSTVSEILSDDFPSSYGPLPNIDTCAYCANVLEEHGPAAFDGWGLATACSNVKSCPICGWWIGGEVNYAGADSHIFNQKLYSGSLRRYSAESAALPVEALRLALKKSPKLMYELNPRKMEELVGSVFRDYYGCEVRHVGRTGDGGIDILLIEAESEVVVQVKRRISKRAAEGVSLVREVVGATLLSGRHQAAIVTTGSFTRGSKDAAESAVALGVLQRLELIDMARFIEMLNLTSKAVELPWQRALKDKVYGVDRAGVICDECKGRRFTGRKIYTRLSGRGTTEEVHEALNCKRCNGAGRLKPISLLGESNIQQRIFLYSY